MIGSREFEGGLMIKKKIVALTIALILLAPVISSEGFADSTQKAVNAVLNDVKLYLDGKQISLKTQKVNLYRH